ncbi:hypothetical protein GCK32_022738 [Trichostrongylus colubriformis]|uniref:Uncharacterized protein n=1 Tax=Trichostrongylus colubriformis TaxID=6319 RepID=A0AAN8ILU4_TRICO
MDSAKVHSPPSPSPPASPKFPDQPLYVVAQHYWKNADRKTQVAVAAGLVALTAGTVYMVVKYRNVSFHNSVFSQKRILNTEHHRVSAFESRSAGIRDELACQA